MYRSCQITSGRRLPRCIACRPPAVSDKAAKPRVRPF
jgi:hypothetical protein